MRKLAEIRARTPKRAFFRGQAQHAMLVILLSAGALALLRDTGGSYWGNGAMRWARLAIWAAVIHQVMVVLVWRAQLHFGLFTRLFGSAALIAWGALFLPFLLARPVLVALAGIADAGSLGTDRLTQFILGAGLIIPAVWAAHSVVKYFTLPRALGGDHFFDRYLNMPMVREGAFAYSENAMYGIVFLGFWGIALLCGSWNALVLALFQHAYVWVHMYCTEGPDMQLLYKDG